MNITNIEGKSGNTGIHVRVFRNGKDSEYKQYIGEFSVHDTEEVFVVREHSEGCNYVVGVFSKNFFGYYVDTVSRDIEVTL